MAEYKAINQQSSKCAPDPVSGGNGIDTFLAMKAFSSAKDLKMIVSPFDTSCAVPRQMIEALSISRGSIQIRMIKDWVLNPGTLISLTLKNGRLSPGQHEPA
jgi:hypothetical protein